MRVDYLHMGGPGGEMLVLDDVVSDGPWPGSRTQLIDETVLGKYFFEVVDRASGRVIYSRGFASIYGEWETTTEVRSRNRTFNESLRFPWPTAPVTIILKKRDQRNNFQELWSTEVDPGSSTVNREIRPPAGDIWPMFESGPASGKLDLLLISEGYSAAELPKFRADAARLIDALFTLEPFKSRKSDFNIRTLEVPGRSVSVEYNVFGLQRYMLTYNNRALRDIASSAPYDLLDILVNDEEYGGGGIFNQQSTVAAGSQLAAYVFVHELAHNLAGLADEYVGNVTYETGAPQTVEPWEPNVTALFDPAQLKWRDLVEPGTPLPTPMSFKGKVGAFEGAGYEARGLYRSEAECIMSVKNLVSFCRVCQRAISRIIDIHTKP
jgi:IgA peptidase M64/peptidase M64-like protein